MNSEESMSIKIEKLEDYLQFIQKGLECGIYPNNLVIDEMMDTLERMKRSEKNG